MHVVFLRVSITRIAMLIFFLLNTSAALADEAAAMAAFDEMNTLDIETARLAAKKGHSEGVRNLGQMIVEDHEPIQQEARRLSASLGLSSKPSAPGGEDAALLKNLKSAKGAAFDKAYMAHELPFSKEFIRKLKEEILPAVSHQELKTFLQGLVSQFEEHLMHIEHTAMGH